MAEAARFQPLTSPRTRTIAERVLDRALQAHGQLRDGQAGALSPGVSVARSPPSRLCRWEGSRP
jgi:hypothetical protein